MPETATFLGIFRNFAVIFPNSNVETFLPPNASPDYLESAGIPFVITKYGRQQIVWSARGRKIATGTTRVVVRDDCDLARLLRC